MILKKKNVMFRRIIVAVTVVFHYKWNHAKQEIVIPFGTAVDTQFDWYGPAKLEQLYGNN